MAEGVFVDLDLIEARKNANFEIPEINYEDVIEEAEKFNEEVVEPTREQEADESIKEFNKIIESEDDFLAKFDESRFDLEVLFDGDLLKMKILPLTPGMDAKLLNADKSIFNDLTKKERDILSKSNNPEEKLTKKELKILDGLNAEFKDRTSSAVLDNVNQILAQHIRPPTLGNYNERLDFWEKRGGSHLMLKSLIANEVMKRIGTHQQTMIRLFR